MTGRGLLGLLVRQMVTDDTTAYGTDAGMMTREVPGDPADDRALYAPCRLRRTDAETSQGKGRSHRNKDVSHFHASR